MSGICGWVGSFASGRPADVQLAEMAAGLVRCGLRSAESSAAHLGEDGALHIEGAEGTVWLAVDGPLWAAIEGAPRWTEASLVRRARDLGHAEALIEAYRSYGEGLFNRLMGTFSLVIVDRVEKRTLLAIDRFGVGTLCYAQDLPGGLVFGTTTDAVKAHQAVTGTISPQQIFSYLCFMVVPSPHTIYADQMKLLPAQCLVCENGRLSRRFYWEIPYDECRRPFAELAEELMALLRQAMARAVDGARPDGLGAFLSGGLDSSTVAGLLRAAGADPVRTFTIGFDSQGFDETDYAELVARHFATEHRTYDLKPADVVEVLADIAAAYDEPFGNSSAVPAYFCARMAREAGVSRILGGDGGDEIFAGNARYVDQLIYGVYGRLPRILRAGLIEPLVLGAPALQKFTLFRKARNYVNRANIPLPDRLGAMNPVLQLALEELFEAAVLDQIDRTQPVASLREVHRRSRSKEALKQMMHLDMKITLADNDLRKVRRMCEMAGVVVRFPFLDEDLVAFSAKVPADMLIRGFRLRDFYKRAMKGFLPDAVIGKKKHGFGMPFDAWPREDAALRAIVCDCLDSLKQRGYFAPAFLDRALAPPAEVDGEPLGDMVWDLMMLELWLRAHG